MDETFICDKIEIGFRCIERIIIGPILKFENIGKDIVDSIGKGNWNWNIKVLYSKDIFKGSEEIKK